MRSDTHLPGGENIGFKSLTSFLNLLCSSVVMGYWNKASFTSFFFTDVQKCYFFLSICLVVKKKPTKQKHHVMRGGCLKLFIQKCVIERPSAS